MQIRSKLVLHLVVQVALVLLLVLALLHLASAYRHLEQAQSRRFDVHRLADELSSSSDELSLMARLYVLSQLPRYAEYYREIARMRDGQLAWPADYDSTYWDRQLADPLQARLPGRSASLQQRVRDTGFDAEELALLDEARRQSVALMDLERQAMSLVDNRGAGTRPAEWRQALELLHGESYLRAKGAIVTPIYRLTQRLEERVEAERRQAGTSVMRATCLAAAIVLILVLHALWSIFRIDRAVRQPLVALRSWAQSVRAGREGVHARRRPEAGVDELSTVIDEMAEAVEHSLAELREEVQRRTRAEEVVLHLANHDALTGLPSLRLVQDRLERALVHAHRHGEQVALLFIDLNGFKPVNDQYGHESGDMVLKVVGQRLTGGVREADTVGRIGGDEFLVILPNITGREAAERVRGKLETLVRQPIYLPVHKVVVQVSAAMGVALYPDMGKDAAALLRLADQDMYAEKAANKQPPPAAPVVLP
jgi:diguanylate cyclase (GGDEF)-like protein